MPWPFAGPSTDLPSRLPPGNLGRSLVGNTFSFHSNAQALVLETVRPYPEARIVRARIINRDVALVVDHSVAQRVLDHSAPSLQPPNRDPSDSTDPSAPLPDEDRSSDRIKPPRFSHREAYNQLMGAFFSEPNILLEDEDEPDRPAHRAAWDEHMSSLLAGSSTAWTEIEADLRAIIGRHRDRWSSSSPFDLYKACKDLSHELVFSIFLGLSPSDELYDHALRSTDTSLRGQFSIPVKLGMGGWGESTYTKGLKAQAEFNSLISSRLSSNQCPFLHTDPSTSSQLSEESLSSHISTFASSLVIKALTSYLTFALVQRSHSPRANLNHLLLETERLAPPIIGVLRRILDDSWEVNDGLEIPKGWDVWLYFPLINRDTKTYGPDARSFRPDRWEKGTLPRPMTFGQGRKRCLGMAMVRRIVALVLETVMDGGELKVQSELDKSVRDFLGWDLGANSSEAEKWAGIKQLPVQRPKEPVIVILNRKH